MLALPPELTHEVAAKLAVQAKRYAQLQTSVVVIDASGLQTFDSSALAVLLACRREALLENKTFSLHGLPTRLRQLAALYGVTDLIEPPPPVEV